MLITWKGPSCISCFQQAKKALFKYRRTCDKVRVWANYKRNIQVSKPEVPSGGKPVCVTCKRVMETMTYHHWAELVDPQCSQPSD